MLDGSDSCCDLPAAPALGSAAATAPTVLEAHGLAYRFGNLHAVRGVDLRLARGEVFGFLGRNGAGKTTTIRMLMGMIRPHAGTLRFFGGEPCRRTRTSEKRRIGYVSQAQHFYPWMNANRLGRFVGGLYPSWDQDEFTRLLDRFHVPGRQTVASLSGGTRAKLALALALAPRPELLILDEPMAGLDAVARREFLDLLRAHAAEHGRTTFLSSHRIQEIERVCDRVGILDRGRLVYDGTILELRRLVRAVQPPPGVVDPVDLPAGFKVLERRGEGEATRWIVHAERERWESFGGEEPSMVELGLEDIFIALVSAADRAPENL